MEIKGLTYVPDFLNIQEQEVALNDVDSRPWCEDLKRRVQHYGYRYDYTAKRVDQSMYLGPLPEFAAEIGDKLVVANLFQRQPDQLIVNEYLPGQGIAPHVDCVPCFADQIATISLGWAYEMNFTRRDREGDLMEESLLLEVGSVAIIEGQARYIWRHQIKARKQDRGIPRQRRVSLTFRNVNLEG